MIDKILYWLGFDAGMVPHFVIATIGVLLLAVAVAVIMFMLDVIEAVRKEKHDDEKLEKRFKDHF